MDYFTTVTYDPCNVNGDKVSYKLSSEPLTSYGGETISKEELIQWIDDKYKEMENTIVYPYDESGRGFRQGYLTAYEKVRSYLEGKEI